MRLGFRVQQNCRRAASQSEQRPVERWSDSRVKRGRNVAHHADDLVARNRHVLISALLYFDIEEDSLADRIFARKDGLRHRLVDHDLPKAKIIVEIEACAVLLCKRT